MDLHASALPNLGPHMDAMHFGCLDPNQLKLRAVLNGVLPELQWADQTD